MVKDKPKVFLFGTNPASVLNSLTIGFKEIGIPVKAVTFDFNRSSYNNYSAVEVICTDNNPGKLKLVAYKIKGLFILIKYLLWCDVVHLYGTSSKMSYWVVSKLARHKFITFVGSEIRVPAIELDQNPYFKYAYEDEGYEYKAEAQNKTGGLLSFLKRLHFKFIVWDVSMFFDKLYNNDMEIVPHASVNKDVFTLKAPNKVPLLIHSPTAPVAKGSKFVIAAIEALKKKNIAFEFRLLENIPNEEYLKLLKDADIYIDQLIWGAYGVAAQQAMQMGKTVVVYVTAQNEKLYGDDCPVQNANIDNLEAVLEKLIGDAGKRKRLSEASMAYFDKMHSSKAVATKMISAYRRLSV